jgi:hypothetical protein
MAGADDDNVVLFAEIHALSFWLLALG